MVCLVFCVMFSVDIRSVLFCFFFFQAEDGIRYLVRSRGLGDVYKRQPYAVPFQSVPGHVLSILSGHQGFCVLWQCDLPGPCLLYTSDAADDLLCVDLGGRRIIKKKKQNRQPQQPHTINKNT